MDNKEMYDSNGDFNSFGHRYGNVRSDVSLLRDTYLRAEKDYFLKLLENPDIRSKLAFLLSMDMDRIAESALSLHNDIENGNIESEEELEMMKSMSPEKRELYHLKSLEEAEELLCLLLAAIRDKALIKELILSLEKEEVDDFKRTR